MKQLLLITCFFLIAITEGKSQSLEVGFGLGSGSAYTFENMDSNIDIDYSLPFSSYLL